MASTTEIMIKTLPTNICFIGFTPMCESVEPNALSQFHVPPVIAQRPRAALGKIDNSIRASYFVQAKSCCYECFL
jgi:hypothetical protein